MYGCFGFGFVAHKSQQFANSNCVIRRMIPINRIASPRFANGSSPLFLNSMLVQLIVKGVDASITIHQHPRMQF